MDHRSPQPKLPPPEKWSLVGSGKAGKSSTLRGLLQGNVTIAAVPGPVAAGDVQELADAVKCSRRSVWPGCRPQRRAFQSTVALLAAALPGVQLPRRRRRERAAVEAASGSVCTSRRWR